MKKTVFKSTLCAVLAIFMLLSLTACGESKMDKIEQRLLELQDNPEEYIDREENISQYLYYDITYLDSNPDSNQHYGFDLEEEERDYKRIYDVDVKIKRIIICYWAYGRDDTKIVEFETASDAKAFVKARRKHIDKFCERTHPSHDASEIRKERIRELLTGEYEGHLTNLFMCMYTAERKGNIVVYGDIEEVEFIMDNVVK